MEKYRKSDQYYIDRYDRMTIEELRGIEAKELEELASVSEPQKRLEIEIGHCMDFGSFRNRAIANARNREATIQKWIANDERQDRLVASHRLPIGVACNTCGSAMQFSIHFFDVDGIPLLFVFQCPYGHAPRKAVYPDGREYFFPRPTCAQCGYEVTKESYKENNILYTTTTCSMCGRIKKDELDLNIISKPELPVNEEDRRKYCLSFFNDRTFYEDLESLANLFDSIEEGQKEQKLKEFYEVDKIEKLTIPALEIRLQKVIETAGFIKFSFDRPEMKAWTTVSFSQQDPTDRDDKKSIKAATQCIVQSLASTNWRLTGNINYRLGYLTGKLKAYERDEDLLKLAKEIKEGKK